LKDAYSRAAWYRQMGYRVRAGGPAVFLPKPAALLADVAEVGGHYPDAIARHNPMATMASRGCDVGCYFCIVPKMEGRAFTLIPDFPVRPVLCDNNLSGLPPDYQAHVVGRYQAAGVPLLDANSGFEPRTFDEEVYRRWQPINRGPWRFAYDTTSERQYVERVMRMLRAGGVSPRRMQVYVLIGNEPRASCLERIAEVVAWGGEPYAQPYMKLNALEFRPHARFDWTESELKRVQRWVNYRIWKYATLDEYDPSKKTSRDRLRPHGSMFDPAFGAMGPDEARRRAIEVNGERQSTRGLPLFRRKPVTRDKSIPAPGSAAG
jgi:hypothetical protein